MLGRHFTHIRCRDETRSDEVMPYLGYVDQMFGLEVPHKTVTRYEGVCGSQHGLAISP